MNILVTGASGFCGTHLLHRLTQEGVSIATHGPAQAITGTHYNTPIDDVAALTAVVKEVQPDFVMHLAGISGGSDYPLHYRVNSLYAANLLKALETAGMADRPTLLVGTSAEYGMVSEVDLPITEELTPRPYSFYGASKLAQTQLGKILAQTGRPLVMVRPFNIIGPGMGPHLVVQAFARQIMDIYLGKQPPVVKVGNMNSSRDFVDVGEVVDIYWRLVQTPAAYGHVINICSERATAICEILDELIALSGVDVDVRVDPARIKNQDILQHYGSNDKLRKILGIVPQRTPKETLKDIFIAMQQETIG